MSTEKTTEADLDVEVVSEESLPDSSGDDSVAADTTGEAEAEHAEAADEAEEVETDEVEVDDADVSAGFVRRSKEAKWYVVHTYSGHENKVKVNIEKLVENRGMQDLVLSVIVPTEDRVELKDGQRKIKTRKMFPGYVIIKMIVTNESWYLVRNTQGVTGFVGHGSEPIPLTPEEVRRMGIEKTVIVLDIEVGDTVKVISGPFKGFMSVVEEVNVDRQTLRARVSMFGRDTLVELEYDQVDKI